MKDTILTYGAALIPQRFYEYKKIESMTPQEVQEHKNKGWLERNVEPEVFARCKDSGCLGDILNRFKSPNIVFGRGMSMYKTWIDEEDLIYDRKD